jgi:hypothetical protein
MADVKASTLALQMFYHLGEILNVLNLLTNDIAPAFNSSNMV